MTINKRELTKYISAFLLGDGSLEYLGKNARYKVAQIEIHKDYIDFQANILQELGKIRLTHYDERIDYRGVRKGAIWFLSTNIHPIYTTIYRRFYISGKKVVSLHDLKLVDWETAAIHLMDDGSTQVRVRTKKGTIEPIVHLHTNGFSENDVRAIQKVYSEKLDIAFSLERRKSKNNVFQYELVTRNDFARKFLEGVSKYVLPSFEYKLNYTQQTSK